MSEPFRGIFSIAHTPYDIDGALIWEDLERCADWIVRAGAHGLVWPVMASEYTTISYPERVQGMQVVVDAVAGRIPVVIGVADVSASGAASLASEASKAGADGVIAMPPWGTKMADHGLIEAYYRGIAQACGLPVIIQNVGPPLGSNLPGAFVVSLCERVEGVSYLKEEKDPKGQVLSEVLSLGSDSVKGVFSGSQCRWLVGDFLRGATGSMPGPHMTDVDVLIWEKLEAGDVEAAREIHAAKMVLENILLSMPMGSGKHVMVRRGVISSPARRNSGLRPLDKWDIAELEYGLSVVEPYFRV